MSTLPSLSDFDFVTVVGPTACGKTSFAVALADHIGAEIISADSRQVYRRMDLGTGKDLGEYCVEGRPVAHHLIDIVEPGTKYNLYRYQHDFLEAFEDIRRRGKRTVVCGGTGLYVESVVRNYNISHVPQNPALRSSLEGRTLAELTAELADLKARSGSTMHNTTDVDSCKRAIRAIEIETYNLTREAGHRERISTRLKQRLEAGMLDEVQALLDEGIAPEDLIYYGLEYKFVTLHLTGELSYDEMHAQLETAIHQFAKRQMTWFRGMERRGCPIHWIDAAAPFEAQLGQLREVLDFAQ